MKRSYSLSQIISHALLFPLRLVPVIALKKVVYRHILRFRNSVPIYLTIRSGDTAIQVGTPNVVTMRRFSKYAGNQGKVIIVEAEPDNVIKLQEAAKRHNLKNVTVVGLGAWSSKGELTLQKSENYDGDHKFQMNDIIMDNDYRSDDTYGVTVKVDTIDNILATLGIDSADYLSITVNGAELEVLKGAKNILHKSKKLTVFSKGHALVGTLEHHKPLNESISAFLTECNYSPILTSGEKTSADIPEWQFRGGDVIAWRN